VAITFTNNWKNILDQLRKVLRDEYKGSLPVYIGAEEESAGTQFIRLEPVGSDLTDYMVSSETREFTINIFYVFGGANVNKTALDHVLRFVSRTEALIHDNIVMTLADSSDAFNCRIESTDLNTVESESTYVVTWVWKCQHLGNIG
jgi:hypothetical protein